MDLNNQDDVDVDYEVMSRMLMTLMLILLYHDDVIDVDNKDDVDCIIKEHGKKLVNITSIDSKKLLSQVFQSKQHAWFNLNNKHYKILLLSYSDEILW